MDNESYNPVPYDAAFREQLLSDPAVQSAFENSAAKYTLLNAFLKAKHEAGFKSSATVSKFITEVQTLNELNTVLLNFKDVTEREAALKVLQKSMVLNRSRTGNIFLDSIAPSAYKLSPNGYCLGVKKGKFCWATKRAESEKEEKDDDDTLAAQLELAQKTIEKHDSSLADNEKEIKDLKQKNKELAAKLKAADATIEKQELLMARQLKVEMELLQQVEMLTATK